MITKEDIERLKGQKNATHKNTRKKDDSYRNTHHTRQGGRTDHSTSSHGPDPSSTDRVMKVLRDLSIVIWGYWGLAWDRIVEEIKYIRNTWR